VPHFGISLVIARVPSHGCARMRAGLRELRAHAHMDAHARTHTEWSVSVGVDNCENVAHWLEEDRMFKVAELFKLSVLRNSVYVWRIIK
jgi:hypothetical protein